MTECECGNARKPSSESCESCTVLDRERVKYDDIARRVRRALRWYDWVTPSDLCNAHLSEHEAMACDAALARMAKKGVAEKMMITGRLAMYRLRQRRAA